MKRRHGARSAGLALLALVLALGPFYQGLFFDIPILVSEAVLAVGFGLWAYGRRRDRLGLGLWTDWPSRLLLALLAAYLLQFGWASYARGNVDWVLRILVTWLTFTMVREEADAGITRFLAWFLTAVSAVVAGLGLLEYGGFFLNAPGLARLLQVESLAVGDRLYSVLQYPNAAAALFLVVLIMSNGLLIDLDSLPKRAVAAAMSGLVALGFFFTLSRGVMVLVPITVLVLWIGMARDRVLASVLMFISAVGVPVLIGLRTVPAAAAAGSPGLVMVWALLGSAASVAATATACYLLRLPARKVWLGIGGVALAGVVGLGVLLSASPAGGALGRLLDISLQTENVQERFEFSRDGLTAFAMQPWGYGGRAWERTYPRIQTVYYVARQAHNHYVQTLVEGGALGFAALAGALGAAAWGAFRNRGDRALEWHLTAGASVIILHAAIDITLSYYHLWLLLWVLLAAGLPASAPKLKQEKPYAWLIAGSAALVAILASSSLAVAAVEFDKAQVAALLGDNDKAVRHIQRALKLDPLNAEYWSIIASPSAAARAARLDPHNPDIWDRLAELLLAQGDVSGALQAAYRALEAQPMNLDRYTRVADVANRLLDHGLSQQERDTVLAEARKLVELGRDLEERAAIAAPRQHMYPYTKLEWNAALHLAVGKASFLVGDYAGAEAHLSEAARDRARAGQANLWLHALYSRDGRGPDGLPSLDSAALESDLYSALRTWNP